MKKKLTVDVSGNSKPKEFFTNHTTHSRKTLSK